jgi:hypothetical protein
MMDHHLLTPKNNGRYLRGAENARDRALLREVEITDETDEINFLYNEDLVEDFVEERDDAEDRHLKQNNRKKNKNKNKNNKNKRNKKNKKNKKKRNKSNLSMTPEDGSKTNKNTIAFRLVSQGNNIDNAHFTLVDPKGKTHVFAAEGRNKKFSLDLTGFQGAPGDWNYYYTIKKTDGTVEKSQAMQFSVRPSDVGSTGDVFQGDGVGAGATGRIVFTLKIKDDMQYFVCSGTVVKNTNRKERSIVVTAGHCLYDTDTDQFATNAMFIPYQEDSTSGGTNAVCIDDPKGCWFFDAAVVHSKYAGSEFPNNHAWDYGFYIVSDHNSYDGGIQTAQSTKLDSVVEPLPISFNDITDDGDVVSAFGHTLKNDPDLTYCSETVDTIRQSHHNSYFLPHCMMKGGASGGAWIHTMDILGEGKIVSVNSWGYPQDPGMAGPIFATSVGSKAECLYNLAQNLQLESKYVVETIVGEISGC